MMNKKAYSYLGLCTTILLLSGCVTAGAGSNVAVQTTVEKTNRSVQTIEKDVATLTRTTADISARLNATEQKLLAIQTLTEDNQHGIAQLQTSLDTLTRFIYQQGNMTPPTGPVVTPPTAAIVNPGDSLVSMPPTGINPPPPTTGTLSPGPSVSTTPPTGVTPDMSVDIDQHYRVAQDYYSKGDFGNALKEFYAHTIQYPNSIHFANAIYWRAHCYFKMENFHNAVKGYEKLRTNHPTSEKVPFSIYNEAVAYSRLQQPEKAKALFQQLIREYPNDATTERARAGLRQLQGIAQ
jgi:tol-pal system protein YbgF